MLLRPHNPICSVRGKVGSLKLEQTGDMLLTLSCWEDSPFPNEHSVLFKKSSIGEFLHSISKHSVDS